MANGQDFVRQLRQDTEALMRRVTDHVFVRDTIDGLLPQEALVRFAVQEHHYVRGIYDYFAMCVLQAPELDMKEWFIEVASVKTFIREAEEEPEITARPLNLGLSSPVAKLGQTPPAR